MSPLWISAAVGFITLLVVLMLLKPSRFVSSNEQSTVQVVVLGDLGRSPRMRYHAQSIAELGRRVELIGIADTPLDENLTSSANVRVIALTSTPRWLQTSNVLLFFLLGPLKVLYQIWSLWQTLAYRTAPAEWMLVQNPPSIPTIFIATFVCYLRGTRLIIDWHNFGYSILALKLGELNPLVGISYTYEFLFGRLASVNITVTDAMKTVLRKNLGPAAHIETLYDRAAKNFQPFTEQQRLAFLQQYNPVADHYNDIAQGRAKVLVSSTSWTSDEDFSILLDALCQYSESFSEQPQLPKLVVVITGKGPEKEHYVKLIKKLEAQELLDKVHIITDWLSFSDYASLLASADLGVSLHTSSSGVDLPMKVVDMFGVGLPVLGWSNFAAWSELVTENVNGRGFSNSEELASALQELLRSGNPVLSRLKEGAMKESSRRWNDEWNPVMGKLLASPGSALS